MLKNEPIIECLHLVPDHDVVPASGHRKTEGDKRMNVILDKALAITIERQDREGDKRHWTLQYTRSVYARI
jgi:hypothetical protein